MDPGHRIRYRRQGHRNGNGRVARRPAVLRQRRRNLALLEPWPDEYQEPASCFRPHFLMFLPNKAQDQKEHTLSVWLHAQRIDYGAGKLIPAKKSQLNKVMLGWRQGRPRRG